MATARWASATRSADVSRDSGVVDGARTAASAARSRAALLGLMTGYCSVSVTGFSFLARSGAAAGCSCGQGEE
ncbi:hypothetical protein ACFQX8_21505 [Klenkia terrae]|uniref:hypothetical protein n=1 Tax=Klenkia terrae TaxID=1052259 RepID=UPI00361F5BD0